MSNVSPSDILTAIKNVVTGINAIAQNYLNVQGIATAQALTTDTVVRSSVGRLCRVSVTVGGSASGTIYDSNSPNTVSKPIYIIPMTIGVYEVNLPVQYGIFVSPGTGQTLTVSHGNAPTAG